MRQSSSRFIVPAAMVSVLAGGAAAQVEFEEPRYFAAGNSPIALAIGDFNEDGLSDIVAANESSKSVSLLLGFGGGAFDPPVPFDLGDKRPLYLLAADLSGDDHLDVALTTTDDRGIYFATVLLGDGTGGFDVPSNFGLMMCCAQDVDVADVNEDLQVDLIVAHAGHFVSILVGDGTGRFTPMGAFPVSGSPGPLLSGDVDRDGDVDLFIKSVDRCSLTVLYNDGAGDFSNRLDLADCGTAAATADLNEDGIPDLITFDSSSRAAIVFLADGNGWFTFAGDFPIGCCTSLALAPDLNSDGHADVVGVSNSFGAVFSVLVGDGDGWFRFAPQLFDAGRNVSDMAVRDVDQDGHSDIAFCYRDSNEVGIVHNRTFEAGESRRGNVNGGAGPVVDVLFVNGSPGIDPDRRVRINRILPFEIQILGVPSNEAGPVPFALYAWLGWPTVFTARETPYGGTCMSTPLSFGDPRPRVVFNNTMDPSLGLPTRLSTAAPIVVLSRPGGLRKNGTFFLQGFIEDAASPSGVFAVTNGIIVSSE